MEFQLRHLYRTCLQEEAYIKLLKKYSTKLTHDIVVVFDLRIKDYGQYNFDYKNRVHLIRISPIKCGFTEEGTKLEEGAEKYNLIATTIHELYHAWQKEDLGVKFWNKSYSCASQITNQDFAAFYSECELDARVYENKNLAQAVQYYDSIALQPDV